MLLEDMVEHNWMKRLRDKCLSRKGGFQLKNIIPKPEKGVNMEYVKTFQVKNCDRVFLKSYKKISDSRDGIPPKTAEIKDFTIIEKILSLLKELPDKGEEMIKMGDVPMLEVELYYKNQVKYFTYYQGSIKTPDTSFFSEDIRAEKELFELLMSYIKK